MPKEPDSVEESVDEIDIHILSILAEDPRIPYSKISERLSTSGFQLSSEAVRQRVATLFEITTSFFLIRPTLYDWEVLMVLCETKDEDGAKEAAFEAMSEMDYWFVGTGFGTHDIYAVATVGSSSKIDDTLTNLRCLDAIESVDYFIETNRSTDIQNYLRVE